MSGNSAIESFEVERKYAVSEDTAWPSAADFAAAGLELQRWSEHLLRASYFDTGEGQLAASRIALRHRLGGKDEGWHLKIKGETGVRELLWPTGETVPAELLSELRSILGIKKLPGLVQIANLNTQRNTSLLCTSTGDAVVELADDRVAAVNELSGSASQWREWEAELMPGASAEILDRLEPLFEAAGATRVHGSSKIQRTMSV